jgi:mannose-6-phosphate isomerase class I
MNSIKANAGNTPFILSPASKDYLWGGSRLNDDFNFGLPAYPLAEAWVCSTHPDGPSSVPAYSCTLSGLLALHPEYLGTHVLAITEGRAELPILIKLIDAKRDLSVQVHPDDEYAKAEGQWGKTEMWYVLAAKPGSELVYGFNRDVDAEQIRGAVENGTINSLLNHVPVKQNDLFFVEPGTVHAIGAGCLIAEIQQSSNLTYRLYDYDRVDRNGQKRELHLEKALDVVKMESSATPRQPMGVLKYKNGCASELLTRCKYFQVERLLLNTEGRKLAEFQTGKNSFHALLCTDGCGNISGEGFNLNFFKGDCVFVPAESIPLQLHGRAQILNVSC